MTTETTKQKTDFDGGRLFVDGRFRKAVEVQPVIEIDDAVAAAAYQTLKSIYRVGPAT